MPKNLEKYLSPLGVNATEIATIYGSITIARSETDDVRAGVISAYDDTVKPLIIASLATCEFPISCELYHTPCLLLLLSLYSPYYRSLHYQLLPWQHPKCRRRQGAPYVR